MDPNSITLLSDLLKGPKDKGEEDIDTSARKISPYMTPGTIGPQSTSDRISSDRAKDPGGQKEIWSTEEVPTQVDRTVDDPRPSPEYDIKFKQAVAAEDVFLGMGVKNQSTACCEDLVVCIKLPDTKYQDITLDVTERFLDCQTPNNYLGLHLPHAVDHKNGKAKWLTNKGELQVSLRMTRELDYLNQLP